MPWRGEANDFEICERVRGPRNFGTNTPLDDEEEFAKELGGEAGGDFGGIEGGSEFDEVEGDEGVVLEDLEKGFAGGPVDAAGFGGAGAGDEGGIEEVDIEGEVDGGIAKARESGAEGVGGGGDEAFVSAHFLKLLAGAGADAELEEAVEGEKIEGAAHGAGVGVGRAIPLVAEVGVGVELEDEEVGVFFESGADGAGGDGMFAADDGGNGIGREDFAGGLVGGCDDRFGSTVGKVEVAEVREGEVCEIAVESWGIGFDPGVADGAEAIGSAAGAGAEGGGTIVADTENGGVAGEELVR